MQDLRCLKSQPVLLYEWLIEELHYKTIHFIHKTKFEDLGESLIKISRNNNCI